MQFPLGTKLAGIWEPTVAATVVTPTEHVGPVMELFQERRGSLTEHTHLGPQRTLLRCGALSNHPLTCALMSASALHILVPLLLCPPPAALPCSTSC
jgi:hypothetical protein